MQVVMDAGGAWRAAPASGQASDVGQLKENVGVAGITWPTGADQVLATQLARIEPFLLNVIAIDELSRLAPSAALVGGLDIGLAAQGFNVRLLNRVRPFGAMANEHRVFMCERIGGDGRALEADRMRGSFGEDHSA